MHPKFLDILACPKTGEPLIIEAKEYDNEGMVISGYLRNQSSTYHYPIRNGIPRFVYSESYTDSFGYEWKKWSRVQFESENIGGAMEGHTSRMFHRITELNETDLIGKIIVEFGCGSGRFLDIVRKKGGIAVGIDMSEAADIARTNFQDDSDVLIVQRDILNPPFKKNVFDIGYTIGVLHHTPSPYDGLVSLSSCIKKGGVIACCVYSKNTFYDFRSVRIYRKILNFIKQLVGARVANFIALYYAKFATYYLPRLFSRISNFPTISRFLKRNIFVYLELPDYRWNILDIFDAITPTYASTHTSEEVRKWFEDIGCSNIKATNWGDTSYRGIKQ